MATWTYLTNLSLILQTGQQACYLYANGRNSVQAVVTFEPLDENRKPMEVSSIKWGDQTMLIDYVTTSELGYNGSSGWTYTDNSEQPYNALPLGPSMSAVTDGAPEQTISQSPDSAAKGAGVAAASSEYYAWISCYPDALSTKAIGIRIRTDGGKIYYAALYDQPDQEGRVDQKLSITPLTAINFDRNNTDLDLVKNVAEHTSSPWWYQDNYYFSIDQEAENGHVITRVDYIPGTWMGPSKSFCGGTSTGWIHYQFVWPLGDLPNGTTFPDVDLTLQAINSRGPNVLTLTRLAYWNKDANIAWWSDASFTIYDQFGNKGNFRPTHSDNWDTLDIEAGQW
jgi:hypothetical protein